MCSAPQYSLSGDSRNGIVGGDVDSVILPIDACGGDAALAFGDNGVVCFSRLYLWLNRMRLC